MYYDFTVKFLLGFRFVVWISDFLLLNISERVLLDGILCYFFCSTDVLITWKWSLESERDCSSSQLKTCSRWSIQWKLHIVRESILEICGRGTRNFLFTLPEEWEEAVLLNYCNCQKSWALGVRSMWTDTWEVRNCGSMKMPEGWVNFKCLMLKPGPFFYSFS